MHSAGLPTRTGIQRSQPFLFNALVCSIRLLLNNCLMSFAAKPFSAIQRRSPQLPPPLAWPHHRRRNADGGPYGSNGGNSGARLSGWAEEATLARRVQPEVTFEFWCEPPACRRSAARPWRSSFSCPTETAASPVVVPFGFICPSQMALREDAVDAAMTPTEILPAPVPSAPSPATVEDAVHVDNAPVKPLPLPRSLQTQAAVQQQQQSPAIRPQQRARVCRPQSAEADSMEARPREQLLRLVRLSYTHSDLATRRLLKSSLLHRRPELSDTAGNGAPGVAGTVGSGLLTRQRLPSPSDSGSTLSSRMWLRAQCFILPPLVPN